MKKTLLAGVALGMLATPAAAEIAIGVAGPMTGQYASFGAQLQAGAEQAVADINEAGGVLGEQLTLSIGDDACEPRQATSVANNFASEGVVFVAGHFCSGSSIPASSVYADEEIVEISPASTNPDYTDNRPGPGIYRVCGRDDQQGETAGNYLAENFADANIAIINDKTAYGQGLAEQTQAAMEAAGKEAALVESYTAGEKDYSALISRLAQEDIGVLYIGGYHTEAGLMARQAADQGLDIQIVSGDALVTDEYWAITGDAGEGTLMTFSPDPRLNENAQPVVASLEEAGKTTEGYVLYTYAAIQAWAAAVEEAGSTDFDAVTEALDSGDFTTVLGNLSFDDKGDVSLPGYVFYEWSDGNYEQISDAGAMSSDSESSATESTDSEAMSSDSEATEEPMTEESSTVDSSSDTMSTDSSSTSEPAADGSPAEEADSEEAPAANN